MATHEPDAVAVVGGAAPPQPTGSATDDPLVGTVAAGRYRLLARIGEGAMGAVYRGEQVALQRPVAVKFLHPELSRETEVVARFEREAVASARIDHPNVVAARDFGRTDDGQFFLVMDLVDGRGLREVLSAEAPLPPARVLHILRHVAAALGRAHALGVVHRDVKPENVVLAAREGDADFAVVIDFGIAKLAPDAGGVGDGDGAALTRIGAIVGTPDYMAPEQAGGGAIDLRADLYAFGVMAFEMLTGRCPFEADDIVALISRHMAEPPPAASAVAPPGALPPAVDPVFFKALAKKPADRYASAAEFVDALAAAFEAPAAAVPVAARAPRRRAWTAAGLGALVVLVAAAMASRRPATPPPRDPAAALALEPEARAPVTHPTATRSTRAVARAAPPGPALPAGFAGRLAEFQQRPEIAPLLHARRGSGLQVATATLESFLTRSPEDPVLLYLLGTLYARERLTLDRAVERYARALAMQPALARDPVLLGDMVRAATEARGRSAQARELVRGPLADGALPLLVEAVAEGRPGVGRAHAAALLGEAPFGQRLDPTERGLVALDRAAGCEEIRAAVVALGRDGDARALPALRRVPSGRGCGFLGLGECNPCLHADLPAAERAIEARGSGAMP